MATDPQKIRTLAAQVQSSEPDERLTPEEELVLFVEALHRKNRAFDARQINRDIDLAVREVRAKRRLSPASAK